MESGSAIRTTELSVWYGKHQALDRVTLDIPRNKITAIIGPSGCGKTTLLWSLNRLLELHDSVKMQGTVMVDGTDVYRSGDEVSFLRKKMGLLSQRPQVLPMSIFDNVAYGPRLHGERDKRKLAALVEQYLKEASLWHEVKDRLHHPAERLSTGQQQRLCLARGLAVGPEIILGDEPTSALDPLSAEVIERRFLDLKNEYTIVLVTHILRQARRLADHVVFLYFGKVIESGPAREFFEHPRDPLSKAYIAGEFLSHEGGSSPRAE